MFSQIAFVHEQRVKAQLELLADIGALLEPINDRAARSVARILATLASIDSAARAAFVMDHVVHRSLQAVRRSLLAAYDRGQLGDAATTADEMLVHFEFALAMMLGNDHEFVIDQWSADRFLLPVTGAIIDLGAPERASTIRCCYQAATHVLGVGGLRRAVQQLRETGGIKIVDNSLDLFSDPTGGEYPVKLDDSIDAAVWGGGLEAALALIQHDPVASELVRKFVQYLVPLRQEGDELTYSFSARNLPGVIFKSNERAPHLIGETLVHEADHQFFYAIDHIGEMWASDVTLQKPEHYSPWRDDPRPLDGILRGLSSFARVSRYYVAILSAAGLNEVDYAAAGAVFAQRFSESRTALTIIDESQDLSEFGQAYVTEIRGVLTDVQASAGSFRGFDTWMSQASAEAKSHRQRWELANGRA